MTKDWSIFFVASEIRPGYFEVGIVGIGNSSSNFGGRDAQERSRLVFAERPRCFTDLDRLCVMSRNIQVNDESRGPMVARDPNYRTVNDAPFYHRTVLGLISPLARGVVTPLRLSLIHI